MVKAKNMPKLVSGHRGHDGISAYLVHGKLDRVAESDVIGRSTLDVRHSCWAVERLSERDINVISGESRVHACNKKFELHLPHVGRSSHIHPDLNRPPPVIDALPGRT